VIVRRSVMGLVAVCTLATSVVGCGSKDEDDGAAPPPTTSVAATPAPTPAPTPTPQQTTQVMPEGTTPPAGGSRVKTELENRPDGLVGGKPLAAPGARAVLQHATTWTAAPAVGGVVVAKGADDKGRLAATTFTGDPMAKVTEAATAAGLTGCTWSPPQPIANVGKDKIAAMGADGTCTRGTTKTTAAYVAAAAEGLLVVGGFDEAGGDEANVFGGMRSIARAGTGGDITGIKACCQALSQNAKSAPPHQQGAYLAAAGACNSLLVNPQGRQGLAAVRGLLLGAGVPAACR
jgi:hypothetical protein